MTDSHDRVPCPHPIEFRGGVDCHLCGNSGFVLPGSPWLVPPAEEKQELDWDRGEPGQKAELRPNGSLG